MKIAIDIRIWNNKPSGVGFYLRNLLAGLQVADSQNEYILIATRGSDLGGLVFPKNTTIFWSAFSPEQHPVADVWGHYFLPGKLSRLAADLFHGPAFFAPFGKSNFPGIVTIHDLAAFRFPETLPRKFAAYLRWLVRRVVRKVDHVIAVSENTKNDLVQLLKTPPEKITVIYEAVDPVFQPPKDVTGLADKITQKFQIQKKYLLYVGTVEPRKNLINLFKAFQQIAGKLGDEYQLVVCGQKGWLANPIYDFVRDERMDEQIKFLGYVSSADLPLLYQGAAALVYPSLYEGFGLPPLEAMTCGIPVIGSQNSAISEVVSDAGLLVSATDAGQLAAAMLEIVQNEALRRQLSQRSLARAQQFSWQRAARETLALYSKVLQEKIHS